MLDKSALYSPRAGAGLPADVRHVLLTAALASPHPDAPDAHAHPTDVATVRGALEAGLEDQIRVRHEAEVSFDPVRSFHATITQGRLCIKGAPEALLPRCTCNVTVIPLP